MTSVNIYIPNPIFFRAFSCKCLFLALVRWSNERIFSSNNYNSKIGNTLKFWAQLCKGLNIFKVWIYFHNDFPSGTFEILKVLIKTFAGERTTSANEIELSLGPKLILNFRSPGFELTLTKSMTLKRYILWSGSFHMPNLARFLFSIG